MAIGKVIEYLKKFGYDNCVLQFDESSATVPLAAKAVGCGEAQIAKTLSFDIFGKYVLIVVAGDCKVDNAKYKARFGTKAKMIPFDFVEGAVGHSVGGVCPFAVNEGVMVYLDVSLRRFDYVYPACGSSNSAIKLSTLELEKLSGNSEWVDVAVTKE